MSIALPTRAQLSELSYIYRFQYLIDKVAINKIFNKLKLERTYGNFQNVKVLDLYPGPCIQSIMFHNRYPNLKQYVLMDSRKSLVKFQDKHFKHIKEFQFVQNDPYEWESYTNMIEKDKILVPQKQPRDQLNNEFLVMANVTVKSHESLIMQWLNCIAYRNWLMKYGRVKLLMWVPTTTALKLLAVPGSSQRGKCSLMTEAFTETNLVAISKGDDLVNFDKDKISKWNPLVCEDSNGMFLDNKNSISLLEVNPINNDIDIDHWDFVVRQLMILKKTPLYDAIESLGHGARDYFQEKLEDKSFLKKYPKDLTLDEYTYITKLFLQWPFKPNIYLQLFDIFDDSSR